MTATLTVKFDMPPGVNNEDLAAFVIDALSSWGGQFHPEDPLFHSLRGRIKRVVVRGKHFIPEKETE
jgi:hypothetical protein